MRRRVWELKILEGGSPSNSGKNAVCILLILGQDIEGPGS